MFAAHEICKIAEKIVSGNLIKLLFQVAASRPAQPPTAGPLPLGPNAATRRRGSTRRRNTRTATAQRLPLPPTSSAVRRATPWTAPPESVGTPQLVMCGIGLSAQPALA